MKNIAKLEDLIDETNISVVKKKCVICKKMTEKWNRMNGGPWHCFDGCYSTTGRDLRTLDGQPAWKQSRHSNGRFSFGPWSIKRLRSEFKHYAR